jgi:hypothetical protein
MLLTYEHKPAIPLPWDRYFFFFFFFLVELGADIADKVSMSGPLSALVGLRFSNLRERETWYWGRHKSVTWAGGLVH